MSVLALLGGIDAALCCTLGLLIAALRMLRREIALRDAEARELSAAIGRRDQQLRVQGVMLRDIRRAILTQTPAAIDVRASLAALPTHSASYPAQKIGRAS